MARRFGDRGLAGLSALEAIRAGAAAPLLGRMARPAELAWAILPLLAREARCVTGAAGVAEGGFLLRPRAAAPPPAPGPRLLAAGARPPAPGPRPSVPDPGRARLSPPAR